MFSKNIEEKGLPNRTALYFATPNIRYGEALYASAYYIAQQPQLAGLQSPVSKMLQRPAKMKSNLGQMKFPYSFLPFLPNLAHPRQDVKHA